MSEEPATSEAPETADAPKPPQSEGKEEFINLVSKITGNNPLVEDGEALLENLAKSAFTAASDIKNAVVYSIENPKTSLDLVSCGFKHNIYTTIDLFKAATGGEVDNATALKLEECMQDIAPLKTETPEIASPVEADIPFSKP